MSVAKVDKLHAVLGGFHLATAPPEYVDQTVRELKALGPDVVVPMHCSGWGFVDAMKKHMPEAFVASTVGSRFTSKCEVGAGPSTVAEVPLKPDPGWPVFRLDRDVRGSDRRSAMR